MKTLQQTKPSSIAAAIALMLVSLPGFAFLCPTTYNQINFGDSIEAVKKLCGEPALHTETDKKLNNVPQEWSYFVPQTVAAGSSQAMQGTLKTSFAFDKDGNLINISVNGIGVGATSVCGKDLQLGNTRDTVKAACGEPSFMTKQTQANGDAITTQLVKVNEFTYNSTPPVTLVFENGVLKSKK